MRRQLRQLGPDLVESQTDSLCEDDEGNPSQNRSWIAALTAAGTLGRDESALLVETKRRGGNAAATRHFADQEQVIHAEKSTAIIP
jgi:hypothetical protein